MPGSGIACLGRGTTQHYHPSGGTAGLGDSTAQGSVSVRLTLGGGTAYARGTRDRKVLGSKFEST